MIYPAMQFNKKGRFLVMAAPFSLLFLYLQKDVTLKRTTANIAHSGIDNQYR
jgi:hypothetical protein